MKNVSEAFQAASRASEQTATIRVVIGTAELGADKVQTCTVSSSIGDGGQYSLGSVESTGCVLTLDSAYVPDNVTSKAITVYYGYDGAGEVCMGVFRTADSLVKHGGLFTEITAYDDLYWSDVPCRVSFPAEGERMGLREYAEKVWPGCDASGLPDSYMEVMRPAEGCTVREAVSVIATAGGCCARMSEGRLVFVKRGASPVLSIDADDYSDFDFSENVDTVLDNVQVELTRTYEYSSDTLDQFQEASVTFKKAESVSAYPAKDSTKKGRYILYISRPENPKTAKAKLSDVSKATAAPWYKRAKELLDSGKLVGIYATKNVAYIGHSCFNSSVYTKMKSANNTVKLCNPDCVYYKTNDKLASDATNTSDAELSKRSFYSGLNVVGGHASRNAELYATTHTETTATEVYPEGATGYGFVLEPELFHGGEFDTLDDMTGDTEGEDMPLYEASLRDVQRIYENSGFPISYRGFNMSVVGLPQVELGDVLHMTDVYGVESDLLVLTAEWTYDGGISCAFGATGSTDGVSQSINSASNVGDGYTKTTGSVVAGEDDDSDIIDAAVDASVEAVKNAFEKAGELDELSYLITMDALAAGQMAADAYNEVAPITSAFKDLGNQAAEQAHELTVVKESNSKTIEVANDIAKAIASYTCETEKSVQRWQQTYTEQLDAWVPSEEDDPEGTYADERAAIAEAYAKLYGTGTPEEPSADSAKGHLNAAKETNVAAAAKEAEMRVALAEAAADKAAKQKELAKKQSSYDKAKANFDKQKKNAKAKKKELDAASTALKTAKANLEKATDDLASADTRCTEAETNYDSAKAELAAAEAAVAAAQAEVDTAMNGLHVLYKTRILQTARQILLQAEKIQGLEKNTGEFSVEAEQIRSAVSTLNAQTGALMRATNMVQTDNDFTWSIVDNTARSDAEDASKVASNFMRFDSTGHLVIGDMSASGGVSNVGRNIRINDSFIEFRTSGSSTPYAQIGESGVNGFYYVSPTRSKAASVKTYTTVTITSGEIAELTNSSGVHDWQGKYWYPYALVALKTTHSNIWKITGWDINPSAFNTDASGNLLNSSTTAIKVYLSQLGYSQYGKKTISGSVKYQILWMKGSYTADVTDTDDTEGSGETGSGVISGMLSGSLNTSTNTLTITIN